MAPLGLLLARIRCKNEKACQLSIVRLTNSTLIYESEVSRNSSNTAVTAGSNNSNTAVVTVTANFQLVVSLYIARIVVLKKQRIIA